MKQHVEARPLTCANCGGDICDSALSPTGLVHVATRRSRCDGKYRNAAPRSGRNVMAVAA